MFPPVPAPFAGSMPSEFLPDRQVSRLLDRSFAAMAMLTGLCAGIQAGLVEHASWETSQKIACLAMLVPVTVGLWVIWRTGQVSGLAVGRMYDRMAQLLSAPEPCPGVLNRHETANDSFAGLVAGLMFRLKGSQANQARMRERASAASKALQAGRQQADLLGSLLREDGADMADAASGIMAASARLANDTAVTITGAAATEDSVAKAAEQAVGLAGSVRSVTSQIGQMTAIAVRASEAAFGAQVHLAELDERARNFDRTAGQVFRALQMAGACGRQAGIHSSSGNQVPADLAANLQEMASCTDQALNSMQAVIAGLQADTSAANRRIAELSALIQSQHELGDALSHAVGQQGEDIAQVLGLINEAHEGFAAVRAGVDAINVRNNAQLASAETLRGSISRLPAHADTIASILRAIPDFTSPLEF